MIPFFVADRPMSLRIIKGLPLQEYPDAKIGIMAHANTSLNFQEALRIYPCENFDYCDAIGTPCQYRENIEGCPARQYILSRTVKMCDSGIFAKEGATLTYQEMFEAYERMDVEYGIMIDVFQDSQATLASAREALKHYEPYRDTFNLVGVAHGLTAEEYLECYRELRNLGFEYIAVGGLLQRVNETVRYAQVRDEDFMYQVIDAIRAEFPNDWLFALGSFHPTRLEQFQAQNVWGDYKGWIFQYNKRNETLNLLLSPFASNHLAHFDAIEVTDQISVLRRIINLHSNMTERKKRLSKALNKGRRELRAALESLYQEVVQNVPKLATRFKKLTTHGLLKPSEETLVNLVLDQMGRLRTEEADQLFENVWTNRKFKNDMDAIDKRIEQTNILLVKRIKKLKSANIELPEDIHTICAEILRIVQKTDQEYRLEQVRDKISGEILDFL